MLTLHRMWWWIVNLLLLISEAATRGVVWKKVVLRNFAKFSGKHLYQSLFFNKVEQNISGQLPLWYEMKTRGLGSTGWFMFNKSRNRHLG